MSDEELINYCAIHCTTERALFHISHVNRMLKLAGREEISQQDHGEWLQLWDEMEILVKEARENLENKGERQVETLNNVVRQQ